jgi:hypothetical protein
MGRRYKTYPMPSSLKDTICTRYFDRARNVCQKKSPGGMVRPGREAIKNDWLLLR